MLTVLLKKKNKASSAAFRAFQSKEWDNVAQHYKRHFDILKQIRIRWGRLSATQKMSFEPKKQQATQPEHTKSSCQAREVDASFTERSYEKSSPTISLMDNTDTPKKIMRRAMELIRPRIHHKHKKFYKKVWMRRKREGYRLTKTEKAIQKA